jgi:hypothetical protein
VANEPDPQKPEPFVQSRTLLPQPSPEFRQKVWIEFQRALDPLAPTVTASLHSVVGPYRE